MKPIALVGEAFGENEVKTKTPFVGASGIELLKMLHEADVIELTQIDFDYLNKFWNTSDPSNIDMIWRLHPEVYRTNVFAQHPPGNHIEFFCGPRAEGIPGYPALTKAKYCRKEFVHELERLGDELADLDPNLVVALGNTPLWALCGTTGVSKLRGTTRLSTHTATGFKVLSTYHPAAVLRQWELRPTTVIDLSKAKRESAFPEIRRPEREIWIDPTLEDLEIFYAAHIVGCKILGVDVETSGSQITRVGFAPSKGIAIVIPFHDQRRKGRSYWASADDESKAWSFVRRVLGDRSIRKVFQNGLYDIAFFWRSIGIPTLGATDDTMLLHHALQPESLKGLGFLGSIYTDETSWKSERKTATIKRDE